jgi:hypothetical protein
MVIKMFWSLKVVWAYVIILEKKTKKVQASLSFLGDGKHFNCHLIMWVCRMVIEEII